ncbi:GGDEF domain-containing protein [Helicobacter sp. 11S02596-1]|uniref:GGDEF domain-containing protein n=1 Tax=Helicobacter sp. 11S02596-1 TaxID=1476194 RepID=UPI000BA7D13E|nr:GGDEF domain-containing protein [Helicobacter sp. 11S02596-1]PAF43556.1 hypothetical protein BJI48_04680 [Helicobacter sp. 11S02596-1]
MADFKSQIEKIFEKLDRFPNLSQVEYIDLFAKELQKTAFSINNGNWFEEYAHLLSPNIKALLEYDTHTQDEFIRRLIMLVNISANPSNNPESAEQANVLISTLIKLLEEISSERLKEENERLFAQKNFQNPKDLAQLSNAWNEFVQNEEHLKILKQISLVIIKLIQPCILEVSPEIKTLTDTLGTNPQAITDHNILKTLEKVSDCRDQDCRLLKKSGKEIGQNANEVLLEIQVAIQNNNTYLKEIAKIKECIQKDKKDFQEEKENLISVVDVLYQKIVEINAILKNKEEKIKHLYDKINTLSLYIKTIEEQSKMDSLTEVYNRKHIESIAEICERQFQSSAINYSILFFDIDNFKEINDIYGHAAGDKLLALFSKILKQNCRGSDIVGRYGGDEFLILMPNTGLERAKEFAKRICKIIEESNFVFKDKQIKITTSIGMTDRYSHSNKGEMIDSADRFLYKAKDLGRNRVEWE